MTTSLPVSAANPDTCAPEHACAGHTTGRTAATPRSSTAATPTPWPTDGHLHHPHGDHCDDHDPAAAA